MSIFFLIVFLAQIPVNRCFGMDCKAGIHQKEKGQVDIINVTVRHCTAEQPFCSASICVDKKFGYAEALWGCGSTTDKEYCAKSSTDYLKDRYPNALKNLRCECHIGERRKQMGNEKFGLSENVMDTTCMQGSFDHKGYGGRKDAKCEKGNDICYAASCGTEKYERFLLWGCAPNVDSCAAIEQEARAMFNYNVTCQCKFGEKYVDVSNENLSVPLQELKEINIAFTIMEVDGSCTCYIGAILPLMIGIIVFFERARG